MKAPGSPAKPKAPDPSQATRLVALAFEQHPALFRDDDLTPFIEFQVKNHREVHPLRSRAVRAWLSGLYFDGTRKTVPGAQAVADSQNVLEAHANEQPLRSVFVRIARLGNEAIYLDLGDAHWRVIEITADGWQVLSRSPVPFRRPHGLAALPEPCRGGTLQPLWPLLTVTRQAHEWSGDQILTLAWLIGALRGRGPYPILVSVGESDAGKSTTQKILRSLIDPSVAALRSAPKNEHDLAIAAANSHILIFDNLSALRLSDELCRLASGAGFATRTLYENREEEIFCGARPIAMNGIVEIVERADLMSRSIFVQHEPIPDARRLAEDVLWERFHAVHPQILGALLDILVVALQREQTLTTRPLPRMADFARFVVAAEPACPWAPGQFVRAYAENRKGATTNMLDDDPLVECVRALVRDQPAGWSNTASALLEALNARTPERLTKAKNWYQTARSVSNALRRLIGGLRTIGIRVQFDRGSTHRARRLIHLERVEVSASASSAWSAEADFPEDSGVPSADDADDRPDPSSADFANVYAAADHADDADDARPSRSNGDLDFED